MMLLSAFAATSVQAMWNPRNWRLRWPGTGRRKLGTEADAATLDGSVMATSDGSYVENPLCQGAGHRRRRGGLETVKEEILKLADEKLPAHLTDTTLSTVSAIVAELGTSSEKRKALQQECASYILKQERASLDRHSEIKPGRWNFIAQSSLASDVTKRLTTLTTTLMSRKDDVRLSGFLSFVANNLQKQVLKREMMNLAKREKAEPDDGPVYSVSIVKAILKSLTLGVSDLGKDILKLQCTESFARECADYIHTEVSKKSRMPLRRQGHLRDAYSTLHDHSYAVRFFEEYLSLRSDWQVQNATAADSTKGFILRVAEKLILVEEEKNGLFKDDMLPQAVLRQRLADRPRQDPPRDHIPDYSGMMPVIRAAANMNFLSAMGALS